MEIKGIFVKFISRNEKSGESRFYLRADNKPVLCDGEVQGYLKNTPLCLTGDYKEEAGKKVFFVSDCHMEHISRHSTYEFLSCGNFNKTGPALSNAIISALGEDIFSAIRKEDVAALTEKIRTNTDVVYRALSLIKSYLDFEEIYEYLKSIGSSFHTADTLYGKFGKGAAGKVKNNPYILMYAGMDFSDCEKIAKDSGMSVCDKKRTGAVLENAMKLNHNSGNTRIEFNDLISLVRKQEEKAGCYETPLLFIGEEIISPKYHFEETGDKLYIYTADDYEHETGIVRNIRRINHTAVALNDEKPLEKVEKELSITYSEGQKEAFKAISSTGIKIITGGPGTGKTTLLDGILKKYEEDNRGKEIVLCAPTSCAARRIQEHTGREAGTIHRLLGIRPFDAEETYSTKKELTADLIVVDEGSMVDCEIMSKLLSAVKNNALVLILGDVDQLPSVSAGNVFADLINSGEIEVYRLTQIFRQGDKSLIISNSRKVIGGNTGIETGKNFVIQRFDDEQSMIDRAVKIYKSCEKKGITDIKFYTPSRNRKFKSGSTQMNLLLKKHPESEEELTFGYYSFCTGDKVIFNTNNYDKGYFNGEEGVITSIQKLYNEIYVSIRTDDGTISLGKGELQDIELAYAITAHKSQGGECKNAVILVPKKPASMLKRQLLYVEITRAKENVMILSEQDALEEAISSKYEFVRNTGLIEKLRSA